MNKYFNFSDARIISGKDTTFCPWKGQGWVGGGEIEKTLLDGQTTKHEIWLILGVRTSDTHQ